MSLEYAMLGFLYHKPISGYDMKKMFDNSISHFWSADQSQIYRTLNKLTKDGLVEIEMIIQDNKPNSKVYHITKKGMDELLLWLSSPMALVEPRISWLIQVFFAAKLSDEVIINIFEQAAQQLDKIIENYNTLDKNLIKSSEEIFTSRDLFFQELTFDYGLTLHKAMLEWFKKIITLIKKRNTHKYKRL